MKFKEFLNKYYLKDSNMSDFRKIFGLLICNVVCFIVMILWFFSMSNILISVVNVDNFCTFDNNDLVDSKQFVFNSSDFDNNFYTDQLNLTIPNIHYFYFVACLIGLYFWLQYIMELFFLCKDLRLKQVRKEPGVL